MKILVLNAGSSSQKSSLYEIPDDRLPVEPLDPLWEGLIDWTHQPGTAELKVKTHTGAEWQAAIPFEQRPPVVTQLLSTLWQGETQVVANPEEIQAVGHRVVHGGRHYHTSTRITPEVKATIAQLATLAPVHNPANLEGIEAVEQILAEVPQVAVFDTAFHAQMPPAAAVYPGAYEWVEQGIYRYGFHGTSHQYCAQRTANLMGRNLDELKLITCHLGNGASLAAIQNGRSIDTTMGFTPLDGLMMGSRSGSVDPSILIYLIRQEGYDADKLDHLLNRGSGLLGISGISNDFRSIMAAIAEGNNRAQLAFDLYIHRLRACIGSMLASLAGLDALVFTAGVGENLPPVRAAACAAFEFLGLKLDAAKNENRPRDQEISAADSTVKVWVIHTQEDWTIASECWKLSQG